MFIKATESTHHKCLNKYKNLHFIVQDNKNY